MTLPFVNQFLRPHEIWFTRQATLTDMNERLKQGIHPSLCFEPVKTHLSDTIDTPEKAALYISQGNYNTSIENCVTASLNDSGSGYNSCRNAMPSITDTILSIYQRRYSENIDMNAVDNAIATGGGVLADAQILFHGGAILNHVSIGHSLITTRPLSTSFCPVKANLNGMWKGKYYNDGIANLLILKVDSIQTKAFVFRINGTDKGYEKEVLIASGAKLKVIDRIKLNDTYNVGVIGKRFGEVLQKHVSFQVTFVTLS